MVNKVRSLQMADGKVEHDGYLSIGFNQFLPESSEFFWSDGYIIYPTPGWSSKAEHEKKTAKDKPLTLDQSERVSFFLID